MLLRHARTTLPLAVLTAVATMLALVVAQQPASAEPFRDTAGTSYALATQALAAEGVVSGCREGEFCPERPLTRAQLATILVAALDLPPAEDEAFVDVADSVHVDAIHALAAAGITQGCAPDRYCPDDTLTRAQKASFLARAFDVAPTSTGKFDDVSGIHAEAINGLAASGIAAGCGRPLTAFCPSGPVLRGHAALFVARAMDLVDRVELPSLEDRRAAQARLDEQRRAEEERRRQEEERRRQTEAAERARAEREAIWDRLAQCESGGRWSINTGNGYYGGLQFALATWRSVGGTGYPHRHSRAEQIRRAEILQQRSGWGQWPACSRRLGLR